ncbi:37S ribosomal protein S5 [Pyrenophora tritici-repentis]|nr:37S ribosomal protein S5 [Pyrenophora tritici-repentis]
MKTGQRLEIWRRRWARQKSSSSRGPPGFGLRVQHLIFELARAAGLQDLSAKTPLKKTMNVIKATWEALTNQRLPDEIARARGKKLVDVRKFTMVDPFTRSLLLCL